MRTRTPTCRRTTCRRRCAARPGTCLLSSGTKKPSRREWTGGRNSRKAWGVGEWYAPMNSWLRPSTALYRVLPPFTALLGACATLGKLSFKEPDVQLERIDITGLSLGGGTLDLVFDVYNPNTFRIRSTRMEVDLDLEETHFGTALLERPLDLSPENHSRVIVPTRFEWAGMGAGARALLTKRAVGYGLVGKVILDTPLGDETVALKGAGNVPLRKLVR